MIMGLLDAYDIRVWLGLPRMSIRVITRVRDEVKERWLKESGNIVEYAKTERAIQIKRALSILTYLEASVIDLNICNCLSSLLITTVGLEQLLLCLSIQSLLISDHSSPSLMREK